MNHSIVKMMNQYKASKIGDQTKIREILQQTALLGLERHGFFERAAFYGGTALRILYGLDRFSEDLDFTLLKSDPHFDFVPYLDGMKKELEALGFSLEVSKKTKTKETQVVSAFMKMNTIELYLSMGEETKSIHPDEKIQIKLEIDIDPPPQFRTESRLVLNPISFHVLTLHKSDLFAGKMHALLYRAWKGRVKGRDWYDLIWYIQNQIPLGQKFFRECMIQSGNLNQKDLLDRNKIIALLKERIGKIDWESAKADMRNFTVHPERLNIWSPQFFLDLSEHLLVE